MWGWRMPRAVEGFLSAFTLKVLLLGSMQIFSLRQKELSSFLDSNLTFYFFFSLPGVPYLPDLILLLFRTWDRTTFQTVMHSYRLSLIYLLLLQ